MSKFFKCKACNEEFDGNDVDVKKHFGFLCNPNYASAPMPIMFVYEDKKEEALEK